MVISLSYQLEIASSLHVGSGTGLPGLIDEFVVRDADGFAYVPASEIKGMLRSSCSQLARIRRALDQVCEGQRVWLEGNGLPIASSFCALQGRDLCLMCAIFGAPSVPGSFWFSPAVYAEPYRQLLQGLALQDRDSTTSAHAAIDPGTRRARSHQLFNLEVVRPDSSFQGNIQLLTWQGQPAFSEDTLLAWLTASLLFTRHIGGRRRRGWGRCRFLLSPHRGTNDEALQHLKHWLGGDNANI